MQKSVYIVCPRLTKLIVLKRQLIDITWWSVNLGGWSENLGVPSICILTLILFGGLWTSSLKQLLRFVQMNFILIFHFELLLLELYNLLLVEIHMFIRRLFVSLEIIVDLLSQYVQFTLELFRNCIMILILWKRGSQINLRISILNFGFFYLEFGYLLLLQVCYFLQNFDFLLLALHLFFEVRNGLIQLHYFFKIPRWR